LPVLVEVVAVVAVLDDELVVPVEVALVVPAGVWTVTV